MPELLAGSGITITPDVGAGTITLSGGGGVTPQQFGAVADGSTDDSAAFVAAIAALKAYALNTGGSGFYKGSPKLFVPAGHYYMGTTTIDVAHSVLIEGEGSGRYGPGAGGSTRLRWAAGANGIRVQGPNTSGNTTVDGVTHDGAGTVLLRGICLQGGYSSTEGDYHGLVCRKQVTADDLYIKNWQGEGVKLWAGNVIDESNVGGDVSVSCFTSVKVEGCRGGFDVRGSDANIVTFLNCEAYQNRRFGYLGDNGAGANNVQGMHCASNGDVSGTTPTKCTYSSKWYAAKWGGDFTVAPSGTTADTADWLYISAGSADATHPAHTATPNTFRAGGDYVTINSDATTFIAPYSEGNGFSQFNNQAILINPVMIPAQRRGGSVIGALSDGLNVQLPGSYPLWLQTSGGETGLWARDEAAVTFGYLDWIKNGPVLLNSHTGLNNRIDGATVNTLDAAGLALNSGQVVSVNGQQIIRSRYTKPGTPTLADVIACLDHHGLWG